MSIGAAIYGYRNNFGCKKTSGKKAKSTRIKLFNLIVHGYENSVQYDDDYFVSIAQYFMKKGYPNSVSITENKDNLKDFFMKCLFSRCPFHYENLYLNKSKFNVVEWRNQFEMFDETQLKTLNFYRKRSDMPLEDFTSFNDISKIIYTKYGKYNAINEKLKFSFNDCHKDATWILNKYCAIHKFHFTYTISYGCKDDHEDKLNNKSHSSWEIQIESEINENYIDFCLRIHENYNEIISGNKDVLLPSNNYSIGNYYKLIKNKINEI